VGARGCSALAFADAIGVGVGIGRDASRDMRAAGRLATEEALRELAPQPGHAALLLFIDPTAGDEAAAIDGAYSVTGARMPLAGGGANGMTPAVIADDDVRTDAVVAVAFCSPEPIAVATADGCRPCGGPAIATRTDGRVLLELNGMEAEQVYLESLGCPGATLDDDAFERFAVVHPLAQPELGGQLRLRHVIGRAPGGGLRCATRIPPNAAVWFTEQTQRSIVASAGDAVRTTLGHLPHTPQAALVFDCAARKRALGGLLDEEGRVLGRALRGVDAVAGLYTRGEVARTRGAKGDRNHAIVVVGFG
jgi:hypothetical protein